MADDCYSKLLVMRENLPFNLKEKFSLADVKRLADSLEDGSVLAIIRELEEIQALTENSLLKSRIKVVNDHKKQLGELSRRHETELHKITNNDTIILFKARQEREKQDLQTKLSTELRMKDQHIVLELDQIITSQQNTLTCAEVPLFRVTNDPIEIELQSKLLQIILRIQ